MIDRFRREIFQLKNNNFVDETTLHQFLRRIKQGNLTQDRNEFDHICAFFLPLDLINKKIYLGHHIKANDWIPPGGHIEKGEMPIDTVRREFVEELDFNLTKQTIDLFDLSIKDVSGNPLHKCKLHFDFWYLVHISQRKFKFDKKEFYAADWFQLPEALKKIKLQQYNKIIAKLSKIFEL